MYKSPLIEKHLKNIDPEKLRKTKKRMLIASAIYEAMKDKGWNMKQLAEKMGKKPPEITKWLSGTHNFNLESLLKLEQVLGIELIQVNSSHLIKTVQSIILKVQVQAPEKQKFEYSRGMGDLISVYTLNETEEVYNTNQKLN